MKKLVRRVWDSFWSGDTCLVSSDTISTSGLASVVYAAVKSEDLAGSGELSFLSISAPAFSISVVLYGEFLVVWPD